MNDVHVTIKCNKEELQMLQKGLLYIPVKEWNASFVTSYHMVEEAIVRIEDEIELMNIQQADELTEEDQDGTN